MHWQFRFARLACAPPLSLQSALTAAGITLKSQLQFTLQATGERRAREDVIGVRGLSEEDIHERGIEIGESESRLNFGGISIEEGP